MHLELSSCLQVLEGIMNVWERISTIPYIKNLKNLIPQVIMPTISSRYPYSFPVSVLLKEQHLLLNYRPVYILTRIYNVGKKRKKKKKRDRKSIRQTHLPIHTKTPNRTPRKNNGRNTCPSPKAVKVFPNS
jgi:hypothetical protein